MILLSRWFMIMQVKMFHFKKILYFEILFVGPVLQRAKYFQVLQTSDRFKDLEDTEGVAYYLLGSDLIPLYFLKL